MSDKLNQITIDGIAKEETRKVNEKLGFFNHLGFICLKNGLTATEYVEVYEKVIRNLMQICDSNLKNSHSIKKRYENEIAKTSALALRADKNETDSLPWTMHG